MKRFENVKDITIEKIRSIYEKGGYSATYPTREKVPDNYVFDENMSVKWNREAVQRWNEDVKEAKNRYYSLTNEYLKELFEDIAQYLCNNYSKINHAQGLFLTEHCYEEYHSCMSDFFYNIDYVAEFYETMLDLSK